MKKLLILFYSRSGNTQKMAKAVAEGAQSNNNVTVELSYHINDPSELNNYDAIIVGAPTYRDEMPIDFKKLFQETQEKGITLKGKLGAAFGSYGWHAIAPKQVIDILQNKLEMTVIEPLVLAKYIPDQTALDACRNLGQKIAETLKNQP